MLSKCYRKKTKAGPRWLPCCRSNRPPPARTHRSCPAPSRCHGTEQLCSSPHRPELRRVACPSSTAPPRAALLRAAPSSVCSAPRRPELLYSPPRAALLRAAPSYVGSSLAAQTCPRPREPLPQRGPRALLRAPRAVPSPTSTGRDPRWPCTRAPPLPGAAAAPHTQPEAGRRRRASPRALGRTARTIEEPR